MRKWIAVALFVVAAATGSYFWRWGYRLTPLSALAVRLDGDVEILRTAPVYGGLALLVQREQSGCFVAVVRRAGPFWVSMGFAQCGAVTDAPVTKAGMGCDMEPGPTFKPVAAYGGIFSDPRVTTVRAEGQADQSVTPETGYLFVYEDEVYIQPMQAFAEDGTLLYVLHEGTMWEWMPAQTSLLPEPVTQ